MKDPIREALERLKRSVQIAHNMVFSREEYSDGGPYWPRGTLTCALEDIENLEQALFTPPDHVMAKRDVWEKATRGLRSASHSLHPPNYCTICDALAALKSVTPDKEGE